MYLPLCLRKQLILHLYLNGCYISHSLVHYRIEIYTGLWSFHPVPYVISTFVYLWNILFNKKEPHIVSYLIHSWNLISLIPRLTPLVMNDSRGVVSIINESSNVYVSLLKNTFFIFFFITLLGVVTRVVNFIVLIMLCLNPWSSFQPIELLEYFVNVVSPMTPS